jgi:ATP-dependent DNA helicase 2 subunit 2
MYEKGVLAIARWVSKDGMDPKMGVLEARVDTNIDFLLWVQVCLPPSFPALNLC